MKNLYAFAMVGTVSLFASSYAQAFDVMGNSINCSGNMHKSWGIPDGVGVTCELTMSKAAMNFVLSKGGSILVCNPLADAAIAAGGGPEDPFGDALATAIQITCPIEIRQVVQQYNTCNSLPIKLSAHASVGGGSGSNISSKGCS